MPPDVCPECSEASVRWIESLSSRSIANYYRCDRCAYVWTVPKDNPNGPHRTVMAASGTSDSLSATDSASPEAVVASDGRVATNLDRRIR